MNSFFQNTKPRISKECFYKIFYEACYKTVAPERSSTINKCFDTRPISKSNPTTEDLARSSPIGWRRQLKAKTLPSLTRNVRGTHPLPLPLPPRPWGPSETMKGMKAAKATVLRSRFGRGQGIAAHIGREFLLIPPIHPQIFWWERCQSRVKCKHVASFSALSVMTCVILSWRPLHLSPKHANTISPTTRTRV